MPDEPKLPKLAAPSAPAPPTEADYQAIHAAVMDTVRGRWFLAEYARHNRHADTDLILAALDRLAALPRAQPAISPAERVRFDLVEMAKAIAQTRAEIASIKPDGDRGSLSEATEELDSIVHTTERATSDILAAAEQVQEIAWTLRERGADPEVCDALDRRATDIYTACSFQDLTGQRTRKVVEVLRFLEERIRAMIAIWDGAGPAPTEAAAAPHLGAPAEQLDQPDIDRIMPAQAAPAAPSAEPESHAAPAEILFATAAVVASTAVTAPIATDAVVAFAGGDEPATDVVPDANVAAASDDEGAAASNIGPRVGDVVPSTDAAILDALAVALALDPAKTAPATGSQPDRVASQGGGAPSPPSGGEGRGEAAPARVAAGDVAREDSAPLTSTLSPPEPGEGAAAPVAVVAPAPTAVEAPPEPAAASEPGREPEAAAPPSGERPDPAEMLRRILALIRPGAAADAADAPQSASPESERFVATIAVSEIEESDAGTAAAAAETAPAAERAATPSVTKNAPLTGAMTVDQAVSELLLKALARAAAPRVAAAPAALAEPVAADPSAPTAEAETPSRPASLEGVAEQPETSPLVEEPATEPEASIPADVPAALNAPGIPAAESIALEPTPLASTPPSNDLPAAASVPAAPEAPEPAAALPAEPMMAAPSAASAPPPVTAVVLPLPQPVAPARSDGLAAFRALSDEDKIALFS